VNDSFQAPSHAQSHVTTVEPSKESTDTIAPSQRSDAHGEQLEA
jgi:hypothetical protein